MGEDVLGDDKAAIDSSVQRGCGGVGEARSTTRRGCAVARRGQGEGEGSLGSREKAMEVESGSGTPSVVDGRRGSSRDDAAANLNPLPNGGSARGQPRRSKQRSGCECAGNEATVAEQVQERKTEMERRGGAGLWRRFYRFVAVVSTSPQDKAFHRTPYVHSCCVG
uniref:Uncharacterized protein n=1 Tax=Oryza sativa subsp. japonica TaxID=39947 RepID=Q84ZG0_ORYSJ|nr:hypothetical protein [Oryza sativa Japonica Group]